MPASTSSRVAVAVIAGALAVAGAAAATDAVDIGDRRQVFVDDFFLRSARGMTLEVKPPVKRGIVLKADDPHRTSIGQYGSVLEHEGVLHMWYQAHTALGDRRGEDAEGRGYICYARSEDGVNWTKPRFSRAMPMPGAEPNIVFGAGAGDIGGGSPPWNGGELGNVFIDPNAPPEERFRMAIREEVLTKEPGKFGLHLLSSPDGVHWKLTHRDVVNYWSPLPHLDTCNVVFWDEARRTYRAYVRANLRLPGGRNRAVAYGESPDLTHLPHVENMKIVMGHDGLDATLPNPANGQEVRVMDFYTNGTVKYPYAENAYFMFPSAYFHYESSLPEFRKKKPVNAGPLDIRFAASRDGVDWNRFDRRPYVRPGTAGQWDGRMLYMYRGVVPGGDARLLLYYYASDWDHGWWRDESNREILRAAGLEPRSHLGAIGVIEVRRDGFVSVRAAYAGGEFTTPPLRFSGNELVLNVDTSAAGEVRVELQDEHGIARPGFTLADCARIHTANEISRPVRWAKGGDVSALAGQPVRIRFVARDTDLYAFQFRARPQP
jgi:hypothetical protein